MVDMFQEMRARHGYRGEFVLAGSTTDFEFDFKQHTAQFDGLRILGGVTDEELASLYAGTQALIFLSKYEGFGIPVLEAAKFGRRMILSDGGSLGEIAPPSACVIPLSTAVGPAAATVMEYLRTTKEQTDLSAYNARFSWGPAVRSIFPEAYE
jgi:glycosyltransferase involved in cell wall biosynthesis